MHSKRDRMLLKSSVCKSSVYNSVKLQKVNTLVYPPPRSGNRLLSAVQKLPLVPPALSLLVRGNQVFWIVTLPYFFFLPVLEHHFWHSFVFYLFCLIVDPFQGSLSFSKHSPTPFQSICFPHNNHCSSFYPHVLVFPVLELLINEITQYILSGLWLFAQNTIFEIHVLFLVWKIHYFSVAGRNSLYEYLFIHSPFDYICIVSSLRLLHT